MAFEDTSEANPELIVSDTDLSDSATQIHVPSCFRKFSPLLPPTETPKPESSAHSKPNVSGGNCGVSVPKRKRVEGNPNKDGGDADFDYVPIQEPTSSAFKRVFSESDEILILEKLVTYRNADGSLNMTSFHSHIQESKVLHINPTRTQLSEKVRRLKIKFEKNIAGSPPDRSDTHQYKLFRLSKKVWGKVQEVVKTVETNMNSNSDEKVLPLNSRVLNRLKDVIKFDKVDYFQEMYPYLASALENERGMDMFMQKWHTIETKELEEMESEFRQVAKMEHKIRRRTLQVIEKVNEKWLSD